MAQILKQSTAIEVKIGPFLDDADGVTTMTALTLSQADVQLAKNGGDFAQKNETTSMVHESNGWYRCLLDTTDTNTLGMMVLQIAESGSIPVWETFWIVTANIYDTLFSTDVFDTSVTQWTGTNVAAPNTAGYPVVTIKDGTGAGEIDTTSGGVLVAAIAANAITATAINADAITAAKIADGAIDAATFASGAITAAAIAADAIGASELAADAATEIGTAVWASGTRTLTANTNLGIGTPSDLGSGASLASNLVDIEAQSDDIGTAGAGLTAIPWNAAWDAEVQSEVADALAVYDPPTHAELTSGLAAADDAVLAAIAALNNISTAQVLTQVSAGLATYDGPTHAELIAGLAAADDAVLAAIAALNNLSAAQVNAEVDTALADYDGPTHAELTSGLAAADDAVLAAVATVDAVVDAIKLTTDKLDDTLEDDGGTFRFTENALEQAPAGGGGGGGNEWDELLVDHTDAGTFGAEVQGLAAMLGGQSVVLSTPVLDDLNIVLVRGDDYYHADGRALLWTDDAASWPSLVGGTVLLAIRHYRATLSVAGTIVDANTVRVELTAAQTAGIIGDRILYDLTATLASGHVVTLARGTVRVYDGL